jgi:hypothetical protein
MVGNHYAASLRSALHRNAALRNASQRSSQQGLLTGRLMVGNRLTPLRAALQCCASRRDAPQRNDLNEGKLK